MKQLKKLWSWLNSFFKKTVVKKEVSKAKNPPLKKVEPLRDQPAIKNLINDYNLIKKGESKKGKRKQLRVLTKITYLVKEGFLLKSDLEN